MWRKAVPQDAIKNPSMRCRSKLLDEDLPESRPVEGVLIGYRRNGNFLIGHNDSDDSCCLVASECEVWDESQAVGSSDSSFPKRAMVYLQSPKEYAYEKGAELGLQGNALDAFIYAFCEVQLTVEVNEDGRAKIVEVDGTPLASRATMPIGKTMEVLRGTGRTTRMLKCALQLARSEKKVVVVMGGSIPLSYAVNRLYDVAEQDCQDAICKRAVNGQPEKYFQFDWPQGGSLVLVGSVNIHFHEKGGFECDMLRGRQFDEVLYDHHAIEKQTPWIVKMLHAFDPDMQPVISGQQHD